MSLMERRIFVAIPLPSALAEKIAGHISRWRWLPIRWIPPENWHITLAPPSYLAEDEISRLEKDLKRRGLKPLDIAFSQIALAPPGRPARMIWLEGDVTPEFAALAACVRGHSVYSGRPGGEERKPASM